MLKIKINNSKVIINIDKIITASIKKWESGSTIDWVVEITYAGGLAPIQVASKSEADELMNIIEEEIVKINSFDNLPQEPTYLDGFKDGTEYALKLIKESTCQK